MSFFSLPKCIYNLTFFLFHQYILLCAILFETMQGLKYNSEHYRPTPLTCIARYTHLGSLSLANINRLKTDA